MRDISQDDTRPIYKETNRQFEDRLVRQIEERLNLIKAERKLNQWNIKMPEGVSQ